ncbi:glycosyltransferase [Pseudomonadales bacterium]|nr:glycosyltransferase [Pseudomonadales bacterium]
MPLISIITPSFNQATYLEETIQSVLQQKSENIEFIVMDGGSTDGSINIIQKYDSQIDHWVSRSDNGQVDAINQGIALSRGEWVGWQNSDDFYLPGALIAAEKLILQHQDAAVVFGDIVVLDSKGMVLRDQKYVVPSFEEMLAEGMLMCNQALFWRRDVVERALDPRYDFSFDYEFFLRLLKAGRCVHSPDFVGAFRVHNESKTSLSAQRFDVENAKIREKYPVSKVPKQLYTIKRAIMLILRGEAQYVLSGALLRLKYLVSFISSKEV